MFDNSITHVANAANRIRIRSRGMALFAVILNGAIRPTRYKITQSTRRQKKNPQIDDGRPTDNRTESDLTIEWFVLIHDALFLSFRVRVDGAPRRTLRLHQHTENPETRRGERRQFRERRYQPTACASAGCWPARKITNRKPNGNNREMNAKMRYATWNKQQLEEESVLVGLEPN